MLRNTSFLVVLLLIIGSRNTNQDNSVTPGNLADTLLIEINPIYDRLDLIDKYQVFVNTPVCEANNCYSIQINFYYDPIGNFLSYDTLPGKALTKLDHIPFTAADYQKLQDILANHGSLLSSYSKDQLISNTRNSEIDGITGATNLEIKENVIEGAVYSCYTLWHIAHGLLVDSLQNMTASMFSKALIKKLVNRHDQGINYYLINKYTDQDFENYLPEVLQTIRQGEGYYAKNALEKIPVKVLNQAVSQDFFVEYFNKLDYFAQVALLKKFNRSSLSKELSSTLTQNLDHRNSYRNDLIKQLTTNN